MQLPESGHDPVMLDEALHHLQPAPGKIIVDCTVGRGGHARAIAKRLVATDVILADNAVDTSDAAAHGQLIGLDYDPRNLDYARQQFQHLPARFFHANFAELDDAIAEADVGLVDGIFADLGISTNQLFEKAYGLSFQTPMPLDMRLDPRQRLNAKEIINRWGEEKIADTLYELADERFSRRIARKIIEQRKRGPINTTEELAELVRTCVPPTRGRDRSVEIHPATRTFMALRMAVNGEIPNLQRLLNIAPALLKPGGVLVIISFHSGEDRLVKQALRQAAQTGAMTIVTQRPLVPTDAEIARNPRARSAKMRVGIRP
jgi:16S rRNA (cytosine1402-N4)-methyltransferase